MLKNSRLSKTPKWPLAITLLVNFLKLQTFLFKNHKLAKTSPFEHDIPESTLLSVKNIVKYLEPLGFGIWDFPFDIRHLSFVIVFHPSYP
jgi:hypothetical protein